ncbi:MAG: Dam family site-specific DNA-(adenine-N6)-methyltransferase [Patescibacteria group bacterium]|nr:Dam family site-specific DNA-(adenine-N6)-methyltransferase [Patescibacteria group bacterium]MDD5716033.1 Dam family site-specific DNA-(adenine-N6)-methyltransferase [Patescibacteria group bacterium]
MNKPLLRWAGSKRKQVSRLKLYWQPRHNRYVEPFAGSACLFFEINPNEAILGDNNASLINFYKVIRNDPEEIYRRLKLLKRDKTTYYKWRDELDENILDKKTRAVRFLYLNRNCFNGIYRTNTSGNFNVPFGDAPGEYGAKVEFINSAKNLRKAALINGDFEKTLDLVRMGDFVYLDPPFAVTSRRIFKEYGHTLFNISDIPRFSKRLLALKKIGADFIVSYADSLEARHISKMWNFIRLPVRRNVAGFGRYRKNAYELLISNMPLKNV